MQYGVHLLDAVVDAIDAKGVRHGFILRDLGTKVLATFFLPILLTTTLLLVEYGECALVDPGSYA